MTTSAVGIAVLSLLLAAPTLRAQDAVPPTATEDDRGALADVQMGTFRVQSASPLGRRLGLGLSLGWPSAVSAKLMLRPDQGVQVGVGALQGAGFAEPSLSLHADWLVHPAVFAQGPAFFVSWYAGAGGQTAILATAGSRPTLPAWTWYRAPTQLWLLARAPVGVDLAFKSLGMDLFAEVAPSLLLFPAVTLGAGICVGARVWL